MNALNNLTPRFCFGDFGARTKRGSNTASVGIANADESISNYERVIMTTTTNTNWNPNDTIQNRFEKAKKEIRKVLSVRVLVNVMGCCGSCVAAEGNHDSDEAIIWHFGGQGNAVGWYNGLPVNRTDLNRATYFWKNKLQIQDGVYFNHANLTKTQKNDIVKCFEKYDLVVEWDKSEFKCIYINFAETRENDLAVLALLEDAKNALAVEQDVATMC